jgi:nucleotide-binding universal stress UspA family protein
LQPVTSMTRELAISRSKILAAIDLGEQSLTVLREAKQRAEQSGGTWAVCHVLPAEVLSAAPDTERTSREAAARLLEAASPEGPPPLFFERGSAAASIVRTAQTWGADLIVTASHSRSALERALLGSVAASVVRYAHCAVLVARPAPVPARCVLVATDLSEPSLPAIRVAADEATRMGLPLRVVHAIDASWVAFNAYTSGLLATSGPSAPMLPEGPEREAAQKALVGALDSLGVSATPVVLDGPPRDAIVDCARTEQAALVVIGTHGRTGLSRVLLGSVAESVVTRAACSVEVVRRQEGA